MPGQPSLATADEEEIGAALAKWCLQPDYPCVGARSVFRRHSAEICVVNELAGEASSRVLHDRLVGFADGAEDLTRDGTLASFIAAFRRPEVGGEKEFEELLWRQLSMLHELDHHRWDPAVSSDPASPHFAFSVAGTAFFVIGMHPHASRIARRTPLPVMVFNLHHQFEQLRASGQYDRMRDVIRRRDERLQGSVNPMVADHGLISEARQYSGRAVPNTWQAPGSFVPVPYREE